MAQNSKNKNNNSHKKSGMSAGEIAGAAGVAAVSAGAYYLLGPNRKVHQKKVKDIVTKIKKEATAEIKKAKKVTAPIYNKAVDVISENYAKQYQLHEKDIRAIASRIKSEWKEATSGKSPRSKPKGTSGAHSRTNSGTKKRVRKTRARKSSAPATTAAQS